MKEFIDISKNDLQLIKGGESFAYRAGQVCAVIWDLTFGGVSGIFDTVGGITAMANWFGK